MRPRSHLTAINVLLAAGALAVGVAAPASADCCLNAPTAPPADMHIRFDQPVALRPIVFGKVASEAPATYTARVTVLIGGAIGSADLRRVLTLPPIHGTSATGWSTLRLRFTAEQRRHIRAAARREHRRPVLDVQLTGTLTGHGRPSQHAREFVMTVA